MWFPITICWLIFGVSHDHDKWSPPYRLSFCIASAEGNLENIDMNPVRRRTFLRGRGGILALPWPAADLE